MAKSIGITSKNCGFKVPKKRSIVSEREKELIVMMYADDIPMRAGASHYVFVGEEITGRSVLAHLRDKGIIELVENKGGPNQIWRLTEKGKREAEK